MVKLGHVVIFQEEWDFKPLEDKPILSLYALASFSPCLICSRYSVNV